MKNILLKSVLIVLCGLSGRLYSKDTDLSSLGEFAQAAKSAAVTNQLLASSEQRFKKFDENFFATAEMRMKIEKINAKRELDRLEGGFWGPWLWWLSTHIIVGGACFGLGYAAK